MIPWAGSRRLGPRKARGSRENVPYGEVMVVSRRGPVTKGCRVSGQAMQTMGDGRPI